MSDPIACARAELHSHVAFAARMLDLGRMFHQAIDNIASEPGGRAHILRRWAHVVAYSTGMAATQGEDWLGLGLVDADGQPFTPDEAPDWAWGQVQAARLITAVANGDDETADTLAALMEEDVRWRECLMAMADIVTAPVKPRIVDDN